MKKELEKIISDRFGMLVFSVVVSSMFKTAVHGVEYLLYLRSFNKGRNLYYKELELVSDLKDLKRHSCEPSPSEFHNGTYKSSNENEEKEEDSRDED